MKSIKKMLSDRNEPATLSPMGDLTRPNSLFFNDACAYKHLFSGRVMSRSPRTVSRKGLFNGFLRHGCQLKVEIDVAQGFDVSTVLYPLDMDLRAWGIVIDRVGRLFDLNIQYQGLVELSYQGGCCRNKQDWEVLVGSHALSEEDNVRGFYNKVKRLAHDRVIIAGTVGFGLWDAFWMSFDFKNAFRMLASDPDFAHRVFRHWKRFHLGAVGAMLDAGIKMIFFREHAAGFPRSLDIASIIDPFVQEHFHELSAAVRSRGGCILLDCDADEMIETDYPVRWGFDGVGPMLFRDGDDMIGACRSLDEQLILVGSVTFPYFREPLFKKRNLTKRIVMAGKSGAKALYAMGAGLEPGESQFPSAGFELAS
ncbi:MAG: hypothetical protein WBG50_00590 [Desulfomonilaceae bacterium]